MTLTKQTPEAVRAWLASYQVAFPDDWTLDQVAAECHRRRLAGHLTSSFDAGRAIVAWGTRKLATCRDFSGDHWGWIAAIDVYGTESGYSRLITILNPATAAATTSWKKTEGEREGVLREIDSAVDKLLGVIQDSMRLDIDLPQVVGWNPEMTPLLRYSRKLLNKQFEDGRKRARNARDSGATVLQTVAASMPLPDSYREPRLSDFLMALRAAVRDTPGRPPITGLSVVDDALGRLEPDSAQVLAERFGIGFQNRSAIEAIRPGGDFGKYPNREDSLRRAVILAFPEALFDRSTDPPNTTPASVIEAACLAWFGSAPSIKDINAMIKPARVKLERRMLANISGQKRDDERRAKYKAEGLTRDEINRRELAHFLEDDDGLSGPEIRAAEKLRKARAGRKSGRE